MEKLLTDVHTHTLFSTDGKSPIEDMLKTASEKGVAYYGISEHFDCDYIVNNIRFFDGFPPHFPDVAGYFTRARALKKEYAGRMEVLVGGEFGFAESDEAAKMYQKLIEEYDPDFIVNSVHSQGKYDYAQKSAFYNADGSLKEKDEAFKEYFRLVEKSLDVPYRYDIVGHLTYCSRYAPYADKRALFSEFSEEYDRILKGIIERGKILEANSSNRGLEQPFLPSVEVFKRYYDLGGRRVSFASDAHNTERILEKRDTVVAALKEIGFEYITVPAKGKYIEVEI